MCIKIWLSCLIENIDKPISLFLLYHGIINSHFSIYYIKSGLLVAEYSMAESCIFKRGNVTSSFMGSPLLINYLGKRIVTRAIANELLPFIFQIPNLQPKL